MMNNIVFICCDTFGFKSAPTWLNVINYGEVEGDKISFLTKDGIQLKSVSEIAVHNFIRVFYLPDIDIEKSLSIYFRKRSFYPSDIINDQSITIGEVYEQNCWRFSLLLQQSDNTLRYKIIFDN